MINRNVAKALTYQYAFLAAILILLAAGLVLLPKYKLHDNKVSAEELLSKANNPERYISTDRLAEIIIGRIPSYLLIDVRDSLEFSKYSIPGSINVPLKKMLDDDYRGYINQDQYDVIFISNDDFYADQAWIIGNRLGYKNLKVLKGGINNWFNTIINPQKPAQEMPETDFELYDSRKAASMYFGVIYPEQYAAPIKQAPAPAPKKTVLPTVKKKKAPVEGGC